MNLKYRFAFLFSLFVFIVLMVSFSSVYYLGENFRKDEVETRLRAHAANALKLYTTNGSTGFEKGIFRTSPFYRESIIIFDSSFRTLFSYPQQVQLVVEPRLFKYANQDTEHFFKQGENDAIVTTLKEGNKQFFVAVSAYDYNGFRKMSSLRSTLILTLVGGLLLSGMFAFLFVRQLMQPLNELSEQMESITEKNLSARVNVPGRNGELNRIARSFNNMLNRLQKSFEVQRNFVQHASHELRTPLANMLSQTEAALSKDLPKESLQNILHSLREDQVGLTELINSLLLLSQFDSPNAGSNKVPVRIDEVLYETIEKFKERFPDASINLDFVTVPENSNDLTIKANEGLIRTVMQNLVKNAYVYSDNQKVSITIDTTEQGIEIVFENTGQQLTESERENLYVPFYRGENSAKVKGTGLGLSLADRIMKLHNGTITYKAIDNNINRFALLLNK